MTRQELLDALTLERFAPTARVEKAVPQLAGDPDAESHVAELMEALSPELSPGRPQEPTALSTRLRRLPHVTVDADPSGAAQPAFNSHQTPIRKGA